MNRRIGLVVVLGLVAVFAIPVSANEMPKNASYTDSLSFSVDQPVYAGEQIELQTRSENINYTFANWDVDTNGIADYIGNSTEHTFREPGDHNVTHCVGIPREKWYCTSKTIDVKPPRIETESVKDIDGDGVYDDIDADGEPGTLFDALSLYNNLETAKQTPSVFDYTDDGDIDLFDVLWLYNEFN